MKIQSAVIVLAVTITLGVTFHIHYANSQAVNPNLTLDCTADAAMFHATAEAIPDFNINAAPMNVTYSGNADLEVCVGNVRKAGNVPFAIVKTLLNGQVVGLRAVATLTEGGSFWQGKEACSDGRYNNFPIADNAHDTYLWGCPDCCEESSS